MGKIIWWKELPTREELRDKEIKRKREGTDHEREGYEEKKRMGQKCSNHLFDNHAAVNLFFQYHYELFST